MLQDLQAMRCDAIDANLDLANDGTWELQRRVMRSVVKEVARSLGRRSERAETVQRKRLCSSQNHVVPHLTPVVVVVVPAVQPDTLLPVIIIIDQKHHQPRLAVCLEAANCEPSSCTNPTFAVVEEPGRRSRAQSIRRIASADRIVVGPGSPNTRGHRASPLPSSRGIAHRVDRPSTSSSTATGYTGPRRARSVDDPAAELKVQAKPPVFARPLSHRPAASSSASSVPTRRPVSLAHHHLRPPKTLPPPPSPLRPHPSLVAALLSTPLRHDQLDSRVAHRQTPPPQIKDARAALGKPPHSASDQILPAISSTQRRQVRVGDLRAPLSTSHQKPLLALPCTPPGRPSIQTPTSISLCAWEVSAQPFIPACSTSSTVAEPKTEPASSTTAALTAARTTDSSSTSSPRTHPPPRARYTNPRLNTCSQPAVEEDTSGGLKVSACVLVLSLASLSSPGIGVSRTPSPTPTTLLLATAEYYTSLIATSRASSTYASWRRINAACPSPTPLRAYPDPQISCACSQPNNLIFRP
ncbi:hypothetical protein M409DRAFT_50829 [Zasmidium cellare ATCC 36951]|uniref:Uncharacterized protein n=1 Tax=Zasmidium cellare ATCC 36951 TaxID=1080233 RepID=A0A6A6CXF2_ZASCE|nr:uncharacterized protein M409DRAFT_50829 [Zasmidium cellare ATCC 36951]KAF2171383.1 hypothetical protein M409DRAFT_50829 [Zasmidium cellare ATCC 36951]